MMCRMGSVGVTAGLHPMAKPSSFAPVMQVMQVRHSSKKAAGSSANGHSKSIGRRLGVKQFDGEYVKSGHIIVRQRGRKFHPGEHVGIGKDHTLFALCEGYIKFEEKTILGLGRRGTRQRRFVNVEPSIFKKVLPKTVAVWGWRTSRSGRKVHNLTPTPWAEFMTNTTGGNDLSTLEGIQKAREHIYATKHVRMPGPKKTTTKNKRMVPDAYTIPDNAFDTAWMHFHIKK